MDINLTGQFWIAPFRVTGQISDSAGWASLIDPINWLPVFVVLIGAYATFIYADRLEEKKRQYDLKVKVYFEALDLISSFRLKTEAIIMFEKKAQGNETLLKELADMSKERNEIISSLFSLISKMGVVGTYDAVIGFNDILNYIDLANKIDIKTFGAKQLELAKAIRKDLGVSELTAKKVKAKN